ncbi:beta-1,3-galactosyltransferase 2-like [Syngnathoides biaculeatus]|uniref:beta-1,3-galactosyltransferase 2-like n=1 Tax=Syngnathoides biaculeatus TaxID=300417 RepID=UPI002ADD75DE|nr:beta-1,3-galactosyltransferase 2-like [Syngnathoides biaculeatus]
MQRRRRRRRFQLVFNFLLFLLLLIALNFLLHHVRQEDPAGDREPPEVDSNHLRGLFPYLINEPYKCRERRAAPFLVFMITTEAPHVDRRNAIRRTWADESLMPAVGIVRIFLLGKHDGEAGSGEQRTLRKESRKYRDLIQQDFLDSYKNLTLKIWMGLHWVARYCPRATYVMKTDSDMFINTENLILKLLRPDSKPKTNYFTGKVLKNLSPHRDKTSKWYVSKDEYPEEKYPDFCSGTGYVLSGDLAPKIYAVAPSVRKVYLEDVYVGLCLAKLGLKPTEPADAFWFNHLRVPAVGCRYNRLITSHQLRPEEIVQCWKAHRDNKKKCATDVDV